MFGPADRRTDGRKDRLINGILSQTQVKSHTADRAATAAEKKKGCHNHL